MKFECECVNGKGAVCSGEDDVVDWDKDQLDEVTNGAHNDETHKAGLQDFHVLSVVWLLAFLVEDSTVTDEGLELSNHVL